MRWSTVVATAVAHGASRIEAAATPEAAQQRASAFDPASRILGGERQSLKLPGFDLGNSPREYSRDAVQGKVVITTTTNGTQALRRAEGSAESLIAAFVNLPAVTAYLADRLERGADLHLLCAGQDGHPALEDSGCAGALIAALVMRGLLRGDRLEPSARQALDLWDAQAGSPLTLFAAAPHAQSLRRQGFADDLHDAAQVGSIDLVPRSGVEVFVAP